MTNEEYLDAQTQITTLAAVVAEVDVAGLIERAERSDAMAPLIDPTLWVRGHKRLDAVRRLAEGAAVFKAAALEFRKSMLEIGAAEAER